jgi:ribosome-associated protein
VKEGRRGRSLAVRSAKHLRNGDETCDDGRRMSTPLVINQKITLPGSDLEWTAVRASGPGGQNVNKVSSKVELTFEFESSVALTDPAKARLRTLAKNQLDAEGRLLVKSEKTRDQAKNLADARGKLRDLILKALVVPKTRKPTKPSRAAKVKRITKKKKVSAKKAGRKKVRRDDD